MLENILLQNDQLEKEPVPIVLVHNFENYSIDFRLLFWCDIATWFNVKSEIILNIDAAFKEDGIEIPEQI
jgi:small-conductance mechanosensitive channel